MFLSFALLVGVALLLTTCVILWEAVLGAQWLGGLF